MQLSFTELGQKSQTLLGAWQLYQSAPSFENFVEFAVSINSFTEFLIDKGFTALHHASHELEQVALSLFNEEVQHPLPQAASDDLNERILMLMRMIDNYMAASDNLTERRTEPQLPHAQPAPLRRNRGQGRRRPGVGGTCGDADR